MVNEVIACGKINVKVPVSLAYEYVRNLENMPNWFPGVLDVMIVPGISGKPRYVEVVKSYPNKYNIVDLEFEEEVVDRKLVLLGDFRPVLPRNQMDFDSVSEEECVLKWEMSARGSGNLFWKFLLFFGKLIMKRRGRLALKQLKSNLERRYTISSRIYASS